jgi:hypothetical protein
MARTLTLRRDEFENRARARGLDSQSAQARALDVHVSIHNRVMNGVTRELSGPYALAVLLLVGSEEVRNEIKALFGDHEQEALAS